jgi:hypothetical protein
VNLLRKLFTIAWKVVPTLLKMIGAMLWSSAFTFRILWIGVDEKIVELAEYWTQRLLAEQRGLTLYEDEIRSVFGLVAWLTVIAGWIALSHLTVWLLPIIVLFMFRTP